MRKATAVPFFVVLVAAFAVGGAQGVTPGKDGPIVFDNFSTDSGSSDILLIDANGSNVTDITSSSDADDVDPAISPGGKQVAFVSDRSNDQLNFIYVMNVDGSGVRALGGGGTEQESPTWSPDGEKIAFSRCSKEQEGGGQCTSGQIATIGADGKGFKILTKGIATVTVDADPTWSPDGKTIVFQRRADFGNVSLWSIGVDGTGLKRLLDDTSQLDHSPSFSPDGKLIVYATDTDGNEALYLMNAAGGGVHKLLDEVTDPDDPGAQGAGTESPSFSPSGTRVVYVAGTEVWVVGLSGTNPVQLTDDGGDHPDWGGGGALPSTSPAVQLLKGSVGPGLKISFARSAHVGKAKLTIRDLTAKDNFHLSGPGVDKKTGIKFKGTASWTVTLQSGRYSFRSDAHKTLHGTLTAG